MTEKENRIHSLALSFLGQQQIVPNLYADQIIRGYKEGYHQAEKDLKVKEVDLEKENLPISNSLTEEGLFTFEDGSQAIITKIN